MTREQYYKDLAESYEKTINKLTKVISEQEPIKVEAAKLQKAYNKGFADGQKALAEQIRQEIINSKLDYPIVDEVIKIINEALKEQSYEKILSL